MEVGVCCHSVSQIVSNRHKKKYTERTGCTINILKLASFEWRFSADLLVISEKMDFENLDASVLKLRAT